MLGAVCWETRCFDVLVDKSQAQENRRLRCQCGSVGSQHVTVVSCPKGFLLTPINVVSEEFKLSPLAICETQSDINAFFAEGNCERRTFCFREQQSQTSAQCARHTANKEDELGTQTTSYIL